MTALLFSILLAALPGQTADEALHPAIQNYRKGEYRQAIAELSKLARMSGSTLAHFWLGKSYLKISRWDEAVHELETATRAEPTNGQNHLWLARALGRKAEHSFFLSAMRQARRVQKEFETAVSLMPGDPDARFDLFEYYLDAPPIVGGGKEKALAQIRELEKINRRLGFTARARVFQKEQKWDLALKELVRETEEFPADPNAYADLADYLFQRQNYERAAQAATSSLKLAPSSRAEFFLSASDVKLGKNLDEAVKMLKALARGPLTDEDPPFEDIHFWLGQALIAEGKNADAREEFEKALSYDPDQSLAKAALNLTRRDL